LIVLLFYDANLLYKKEKPSQTHLAMSLFITGTDTNVGKTLVSSWVCLHTRRPYWKPIQTGTCEGSDSQAVARLSGVQIYPERYAFEKPLSPHAACGNVDIILESLKPPAEGLVIEGAGGVYVPLNKHHFLIDWVAQYRFPTLVVARSTLGTINHRVYA
jgi:dethiobiotin synthetase